MYAYDEMYLDDAMDCLGEAVDYAANACSLPPDEPAAFRRTNLWSFLLPAGKRRSLEQGFPGW